MNANTFGTAEAFPGSKLGVANHVMLSARVIAKSLCLMKVTLDHNCLIHLRNHTATGKNIEAIVRNENIQCFVVNIGAPEMRDIGVRPDRYETFEELLENAGVKLPKLIAMGAGIISHPCDL